MDYDTLIFLLSILRQRRDRIAELLTLGEIYADKKILEKELTEVNKKVLLLEGAVLLPAEREDCIYLLLKQKALLDLLEKREGESVEKYLIELDARIGRLEKMVFKKSMEEPER